ncbi:hypothetical protein DVH24_001394 [Malus domestica]|uniref:Uncharacterized protein n=1 Tax=Malus domestica TaxID=3750 RepID=A0A498JZ36_MALDO|nr:hypothetical protein DVH24_001394 [Malus domestica]
MCVNIVCVRNVMMRAFTWQAVVIKEIVLTEAASGDDVDVVIGENLTPDTNDVCELKMQLKELKVLFEWLAHEKEISDKNLVKKVEELSNVVEELRRVVMEKPVEENTKEEDEGKKDVGEKGKEEEGGKKEKKKKEEEQGSQIGGNVQTVVEEEEKPKEKKDDGGENGGDVKSGFEVGEEESHIHLQFYLPKKHEDEAWRILKGRKGLRESATHTWQATAKLAHIAHVLLDLLLSLSRDVKRGSWPIDISPRSPQQDNGLVLV